MVQLSEMRRKDSCYEEIRTLIPHLPGIFYQFLKNKSTEKSKRLIETCQRTKAWLEKEGMDPRLSGIYSVLAESFVEVYGKGVIDKREETAFGWWIRDEAHKLKQEKEEKLITNDFLFDLEVIRAKGLINGDHVELHGKYVDGGFELAEVCLWLKGAYNQWAEDRRKRGESAWCYADLQKYFREEPYYRGDSQVRKINKKNR